jgi:hypothetical protein
MPEFKTENLDDMKIICAEHIRPNFKSFTGGIVIGEPDTFILSQLVKLSSLEGHSLRYQLIDVDKVVFFQTMSIDMQEIFLETAELTCKYLYSGDDDIAESILQDFIVVFLEDCLKRAQDKDIN